MAMSSLGVEDHLRDPYYVLWVEAGTCLGFLKTFLEALADNLSVSLHKTILKNILVCRQNQSNPRYMTMCKNSIISFKRTMNKWTINCCANCQCYIDQLIKCCDPPFKLKQGNWASSDIQLWPKDCWEKAKVYMKSYQQNVHNSPQDTDFSDLVNFIDHCHVTGAWWRPSGIFKLKITKVRDCRNTVMHSATFKISSQDFKMYTDAMLDFLKDYLMHPNLKREAHAAFDQIQEVQKSGFIITTDAEFLVLKDRAEEIILQSTDICGDIGEMKKQCLKVKEKRGKKSKEILKQLSLKIAEKEHSIDRENPELENKINEQIAKTNAALEETKAKLTDVRKEQSGACKDAPFTEQTSEGYAEKDYRIEMLKTENKELKHSLEAIKTHNKQLQLQLNDSKLEIENGKGDIDTLSKHFDELRSEICVANEDRKTLQKELLDIRMKNEELSLVIKEHQETILRLRRVEEENKELKGQYDSLKTDYADSRADLKKRICEMNIIQAKCQESLKLLGQTENELHEIKENINNGLYSSNGVDCAQTKNTQQNGELGEELIAADRTTNILTRRLRIYQEENENLKEQLKTVQEIQRVKEDMSTTVEELHIMSDVNNQLEIEKSLLFKQFQSLQTECAVTLISVKWKLNSFKQHLDLGIEKINEIEMKQRQRVANHNYIV